jgi:hypothetical protein
METMAALADNSIGSSYRFPSVGTLNPLGHSTRISEDVFGSSLRECNVWMESPEVAERKSASSERPRKSSSSSKKKGTSRESMASSSSKKKGTSRESRESRRSKEGRDGKRKTSKTTRRSKAAEDVEFAPMLTTEAKSSKNSQDEFSSGDKVGELMDLLRREKGPVSPPPPRRHSMEIPKLEVTSDPGRFKKILEERGCKKSYLPKRASDRVYGADFRRGRRDSVKASLQNFLQDTADVPSKSAGRSVHSAPTKSHRTKVRSRAPQQELRKTSSESLEAHLHSTRVARSREDGDHRSVASAPAGSVTHTAAIAERCEKLKMIF